MPSENLEYSDDLIDGLELIWSEGFLSPGGSEEVAELLEGVEVKDRKVLDVGCGLGGPSCALVERHGAAHGMAIDIEQPLIQKARNRALARNLAGQVDFQVVSPGLLPFDDNAFDLVFSKDAFIHVADKPALYRECYRVLQEGGWIVQSDWFSGNQAFSLEMEAWLEREAEYVTFNIATLDSTVSVLGDVGFTHVASVDRNEWYKRYTRKELARVSGLLRKDFVARFGEQETQDWIEGIRKRMEVVDQGHLRPGHVRGRKPKDS